jgi:acetolactate synthase I/II/III large subunit
MFLNITRIIRKGIHGFMSRIKVADLVVKLLVEYGIDTCYSVVGGSAMHLNKSFFENDLIKVIYTQTEQAAAIAAEAHFKLSGIPAVINVTSGPGGTNAITGVLCAYMDSIPLIVISGQVRSDITTSGLGLKTRFNGEQEHQIIETVKNLTKFTSIITNKNKVSNEIRKAIHISVSGRPGPVWIDIPLDIQNQELLDYKPVKKYCRLNYSLENKLNFDFQLVIDKMVNSKKPLIHIGSGVRISGSERIFLELIDKLGIPITTGMGATDLLHSKHKLFAGRPGITGDRVGNFAIQSCDLLITIGSRLGYKITGYNTNLWAPKAFKVMIDIDTNEINRKTLKIDLPITMDAHSFISQMLEYINNSPFVPRYDDWLETIHNWNKSYSIYNERLFENKKSKKINIYKFIEAISECLPEKSIVIAAAGTSRIITRQAMMIKPFSRLISNHNAAPMGYELPASIGACISSGFKPVVVIAGDGGISMTISELQTIFHHNLPIKIFIINNNGYHSIRQTQKNFFSDTPLHGIGPDSTDLSFPEYSKLSIAYNIPYYEMKSNSSLSNLTKIINSNGPIICEVFVELTQRVEPKVMSLSSKDGTIKSGTLENMFPFLDETVLMTTLKNEQ